MTTLAVSLAFAGHIVLIYGAVGVDGAQCPEIFRTDKEAMVTVFVTRSSSGTLPVSMDVAEKEIDLDRW